MITAYGASKTEAHDAGADDIIYKPFDMRDLSIRLKSVIRIGHIANRWERLMTYMDELEKNRSELAAWSVLANLIMNMDSNIILR